MRLAVVVLFLNEGAYLPTLLQTLEAQARVPDELLLVDDGSTDDSLARARAFAERHEYATALARPARAPARDRLARAAELTAFVWAVQQLRPGWDVVAKLDADLRLSPACFAEIEHELEADPRLGIAGAHLSVELPGGGTVRERCPAGHVRGATKFYRRACFEDVFPLPETLGWDTLDEVRARMHGWRTSSLSVSSGDPIHLRPTATHDGALRGMRRGGIAAYAYGASPAWVLAGTLRRLADPPLLVGGLSFPLGWCLAAIRRHPRATRAERSFLRAEHRRRVRSAVRARRRRRRPPS